MVVLEGAAAVDVEDRRHGLGPLDAIAVMPRRPRRPSNPCSDRPAVLHVAPASGSPEQSRVNAGDMPDRIVMDERFCHPQKARGPRYDAGKSVGQAFQPDGARTSGWKA